MAWSPKRLKGGNSFQMARLGRSFLLTLGLFVWGLGVFAILRQETEWRWPEITGVGLIGGIGAALIGVALFGSQESVHHFLPRLRERTFLFCLLILIASLPVFAVWTVGKNLRKR